MKNNKIIIYESKNNPVKINAFFDGETFWLNRIQLTELFGRDIKTIGKHINNALKEELKDFSVVAKFATTAADGKTYKVEHYNLDMILSVGYRVKSNEGINFRIWANSVLKNYIIKGVAINQKRLAQLNKTIEIISRSQNAEISGVASILQNFAAGLDLLDNYDYQSLKKPKGLSPKGTKNSWILTYEEAKNVINSMKFNEKSSLFGNEKDKSFRSSISTIYQTFGKKEFYPTAQEKAANLLYLIVKNHSFSDGNKRIAAAMFIYFLDKNAILRSKKGNFIIDNNTLAAMTLMIALSKPSEKEQMVLLVMNFLEQKNS
ncbi:MAG: virulence RhuM family protein [Endomicrobia bacterium]|nr:virulence RhuM family protein [Endomicrobiia bacterium]